MLKVRFNYFILTILICLSALSSYNFTYLNPTYSNDWGFIEITHFDDNSVDTNPALSLFFYEMDDISTNYIYSFDAEITKKDVESITKFNEEYELLKTKRREVIDKGFEVTILATGGTIVGMGALCVSFPIGAGLILTEMVSVGYLFLDLVSNTYEYYYSYTELVRSVSNNFNSLQYKVEKNDNELIKMGILNSNYKGTSLNDYSQIRYLIDSLNSNSLLERENLMKQSLNDKLIYFNYGSYIKQLNSQYLDIVSSENSAYYKLLNIYILQEKIKKNLIDENNLLNAESEKLRLKTFDKLKYSTENYYNIDQYYITKLSLTSVDYAISPRDHINLGSKYYEEALLEIDTAKKILAQKNDNYIVDSTIRFDNAITLLVKSDMELSQAEIKANKINSNAYSYIQNKYENALLVYDSFITYTEVDVQNKQIAEKYLVESKKLIDIETSVSNRILNLISANSKIDSALIYLNPSTSYYSNLKEDTLNSLNYLEKIILLAKKDKVDVSYEENYLKTSKSLLKDSSISLFEILEIYDNTILISNDIYDKSKIQYSHLDIKFNSIKELIYVLNNYNSSYNFEEYNFLMDFYGNNEFDKYSSLGHYLEISSKISILENKININKKNIIQSMLIYNSLTSANYYNDIELDVPSKLVVVYSTYFDDSLNYDGQIKYDVSFNYDPYSANEIVKSNDLSLSYTNKKLSILINKFNSSKIYTFSLIYDRIFAKTLSVKYSSTPISHNQVQINIEKTIENINLDSLFFNKTNYDVAEIYFNGEYYGQYEGKKIKLNKHLSSGKNVIKETYYFNNPISYTLIQLSNGTKKQIKVNIKNNLPYDLKDQPSIIELPILSPLNYNFLENTCNVDKNGLRFSSNSLNSKVYFVSDFVSNGQCSFTIEFVGEYNKDLINDEIDNLKNKTNNSKIDDLLDKSKKDLEQDKINDALNNLEKAKNLIEDEEKNNSLRLLKEIEYNKTRDEIKLILSNLSSIENKKVSDVLIKVEKYLMEAESLNDIDKKLAKLISAKTEIDKLKGIGIDLKLNLLSRSNKLMEQWMDLVNIGFIDSIPFSLQENIFNLNSIDFSELKYENYILLYSIEKEIVNSENEYLTLSKSKKEWEGELNTDYKQLVSQLSDLIKLVEKSCGNSCPLEMITLAKSNLNLKPTDSYTYSVSIKYLNDSILQLENYLSNEKLISQKAFDDAKTFVSSIGDDSIRKEYLRKLGDIQSKLNSGYYLTAKEESLLLLNSIYDEKPLENNNLLLIGAGLGAIALAFIIIKIKSQKSESKEEEYKTLKKN